MLSSKMETLQTVSPHLISRSRSSAKKTYPSSSASSSDKPADLSKFANAKSISSDQYFGRKDEMDVSIRYHLLI